MRRTLEDLADNRVAWLDRVATTGLNPLYTYAAQILYAFVARPTAHVDFAPTLQWTLFEVSSLARPRNDPKANPPTVREFHRYLTRPVDAFSSTHSPCVWFINFFNFSLGPTDGT